MLDELQEFVFRRWARRLTATRWKREARHRRLAPRARRPGGPTNNLRGDLDAYFDFLFARRALLSDVGAFLNRELMRASQALVSHAHIDHVADIDRLPRVCPRHPQLLHLFEPDGFAERISVCLHG